jgi:isopenicillin N synthase-like dioxygenase
MTSATIPIIDIAALWADDLPARQAVADQIGAACRLHGFFYVVGAPITALLPRMLEQERAFFALPAQEKAALALDARGRGYKRFDEPGATDWKEEYYVGREGGQAANRWPVGHDAIKHTAVAYLDALHDTAERLFGALALSLGLAEDHFADFCTRPDSIMRMIRYPAQAANAGTGHISKAHTDFGGITLLLQDQRGGLEVLDAATGDWIAAKPAPGSLVINLGDLMARWTNDLYRSTLHRVVNTAGAERFSLAFFFTGALSHPIACLPGCLKPGEEPRYPPTTVAEQQREAWEAVYARVPGAR